ncbi:hypothetical protein CRG98_031591 [Punica granatum]|uniref:Uncharacterized protein n=1 Tax=Punica granatum TaxID=22663 RepID=A0A2I0IVH5_PUNGR|nr:hypothetical protein CRG98_031591 [Punica granatum]
MTPSASLPHEHHSILIGQPLDTITLLSFFSSLGAAINIRTCCSGLEPLLPALLLLVFSILGSQLAATDTSHHHHRFLQLLGGWLPSGSLDPTNQTAPTHFHKPTPAQSLSFSSAPLLHTLSLTRNLPRSSAQLLLSTLSYSPTHPTFIIK